MIEQKTESDRTGLEIAVIGMAGRFPGARNIGEFRENLENGIDSIAFFSTEELEESGVDDQLLKNPRYVKAYGWLEDIDLFDASFFGYTPLEAEIMDPQVRFFHECAFEALENAGYDPYSYNKLIGIYAGASASFDWQALTELSARNQILGWFASKQLNDKDFLATRIAYKLNLKGPAVTVDTACSTSLAAIHMASQGLLSGDCDMALAGGVTIPLLKKSGYLYQEGMLNSPDGHCRAFEGQAKGTNFGNAAAVVVLKRLDDALGDRDSIYAVIKGSAINNDGAGKAAYTAPGVEGQAAVIRTAHQMAEVDPESITYVETHGTGTPLGDPVEIEALKLAFKSKKRHFCRIGSVKTNMGHLEMAAGVTGFIKTVLAIKHRLIPPSLHFETPNPKIDFENSPFFVNTELTEWKRDKYPLRAGVSSFGIGGTNAHLVLEEWPEERRPDGQGSNGQSQMILLSARTETALDEMTENLANHLKENPDINLADAAYTLQFGRRTFRHRRMLVCSDVNDTVEILSNPDGGKIKSFCSKEDNRPIVYMFPGLGSQYVGMGRDLYRSEAAFTGTMDRCFEILSTLVDFDLKEILYPSPGNSSREDRITRSIDQPEISQAAIFVFEYALAQLLMRWGIRPDAMIGYSFGEYAAACVSGVFSLEDALKLVVLRGRLIRELPPGLMLSVPLAREELVPLLDKELSLAVDNGHSCIVSGPTAAVEAFESELKQKRYLTMRLDAVRAIHSRMMDPIVKEMEEQVSRLRLNKPSIPYISNVTGTWITGEQAAAPAYWIKHLRETVQFAAGMRELVKEANSLFIEIGPGRDIVTLAQRYLGEHDAYRLINLVRHPHQQISDVYFLLDKICKLWLYGQEIAWNEFNPGEKRQRVPLPTYPFERQRYWIDADIRKSDAAVLLKQSRFGVKPDIADWFYIPAWNSHMLLSTSGKSLSIPHRFLVFLGDEGSGHKTGGQLVKRLEQQGFGVITVEMGSAFVKRSTGAYVIDPRRTDDYYRLFHELSSLETVPTRVVHMWGITAAGQEDTLPDWWEKIQDSGFYSLINIAKAIGKNKIKEQVQIIVVTDHLQEVTGDEPLCPGKATVIGPINVIPQEFPGIRCRSVDVALPEVGSQQAENLIGQLLEEVTTDCTDTVIAYRGNFRWVRTFQPVRLDKTAEKPLKLREKGIYLLTGGFGDLGFSLGEYLAKKVKARLVLTGRSALPPREEWDQWPGTHDEEDPVGKKIKRIKQLEEAGAEVLVLRADAADKEQMQNVMAEAEHAFGTGTINGVIHLAGIVGGESFTGVQKIERSHCREQFHPKVNGLLVLEELLTDKNIDFCWVMSSLSTVLGGLGFTAYAAANSFMDAYCKKYNRFNSRKWICVDWDGSDVEEMQTGFERILSLDNVYQVIFSREGNLQARIDQWITLESLEKEDQPTDEQPSSRKPRPDLLSPYVPPRDEIQQALVDIWETLLGFESLGIQDDFFELGGDSLKAISMVGKIQKRFNIQITLPEFFDGPTIVKLARCVTDVKSGLSTGTDANKQYIPVNERASYTHTVPLVEEKEYYDLTPSQRRFWILAQIYRGDEVFNVPVYNLLTGNLNLAVLKKTIYSLIERHESLRTVFIQVNGEPKQRIHKTLKQIPFDYLDFRGRESENLEKVVEKEIVKKFNKPFDLEKGPLFEVTLIRKKEEEYLFMFNIHHIIFDKLSLYVLLKELFLLYSVFCRVGENPLEEMRIQYKDYACWLNNVLRGENLKRLEEYWLRNLSGQIPQLELPTDRPRLIGQRMQGAKLTFFVNEAITKKIDEMCRRYTLTLFMIQLIFVYVLMYKYTDQTDIVFTTFSSGRNHKDLEELFGVFVNLLAIRIHMKPEDSFANIVRQVKEITLESYEHQLYPYEDLLELLHVNRKEDGKEDRAVLSKIRVDVKDAVPGTDINFEAEGLKIKTLMDQPTYAEIYKEDLYFCFTRYGSRIKGEIEYYADMFDRSRIELMQDRYIDLMEKLLENENTGISDIDFTVPTEGELGEDLDISFNI